MSKWKGTPNFRDTEKSVLGRGQCWRQARKESAGLVQTQCWGLKMGPEGGGGKYRARQTSRWRQKQLEARGKQQFLYM